MTSDQAKAKLADLLKGVENEVVEFKEAKNSFDFNSLGKYFSALSNEANLKDADSGWLVLGIEDKHKTVVGTAFKNDGGLNKLKFDVSQCTGGITLINVFELEVNKKRVVLLQIPPAAEGMFTVWKGFAYGRSDSSIVPLSVDKQDRIRNKFQRDWSAVPVEGSSLTDLDPTALITARERFKRKNPKLAEDVDSWPDLEFLKRLKVTVHGKLSRACILLLGKPESATLLSPAPAEMTWLLKDSSGNNKDYAHFHTPFLLTVESVASKIRNIRYRHIRTDSIIPEEVDQYDNYLVREALNNAIAHQDYSLNGRITVIEREDDRLIFENLGSFLPGSVEKVLEENTPWPIKRNAMLSGAMVNLNMIDTVGYGIKKMFDKQKERGFPLPDYILGERVRVEIIGKVLDITYANVLAKNPALNLSEIIMLDKVQKRKELTDDEIKHLRVRGLIEGRKPNFTISGKVAVATNQVPEYLSMKGFDDDHCIGLVLKMIELQGSATREDINRLLIGKMPEHLTDKQRINRINYLISGKMRGRLGLIRNVGTASKPLWKLN